MRNTTASNAKLPFSCRMLCVSLVGATILLVLIASLYYLDYLSIEAAAWAAVGVFFAAAIYETFLLSMVARYMLNKFDKNPIGCETKLPN